VAEYADYPHLHISCGVHKYWVSLQHGDDVYVRKDGNCKPFAMGIISSPLMKAAIWISVYASFILLF